MELKLHERRSDNTVVNCPSVIYDEGNCMDCKAKNSVEPIGVLVPNTQGLCDSKNNPMLDQTVSCRKCGARWVNVFCRVYEQDTKGDESGDGI